MDDRHPDSFGARDTLDVGGRELEIFRLDALQERFDVARLPFSLKILLENLLRTEDGQAVTREDIEALAGWDPAGPASIEIAFTPSRVLMQDFTGVPAIVDLAAMRDAMEALGGDPRLINPLVPVELVIDHSIQVDVFGEPRAFQRNAELEFERNRERYAFLRWGQTAFDNFSVVPPNTGICHQVNLEYLAQRRPCARRAGVPGHACRHRLAHDDGQRARRARVGRRRHRGRGGDARPAGLDADPGGRRLPPHRRAAGGATATDLVLTVTQMLRQRRVVSKFVEFYGPGLANLPLADRATIGNMSPEYGATCGIFPVDARDAALPAVHRAAGRAGRVGRGVLPRAGPVPRGGRGGAGVLRHARARPRDRRAEPGRAAPAAGSRRAERCGERLPTRSCVHSSAARPTRAGTRSTDTDLPGERPAVEQGRGRLARSRCPPTGAAASRLQAGVERRRPRPRGGGDRRDHELHEHVESLGHARRGLLAKQGRRGRPRPGGRG